MDESIKILPNFKKFNSYIGDVKQGNKPNNVIWAY